MVTSVNTRQFQEEFLTYVRGYQSILLGIALFLFSLYLYFHKHYWPASPDERAYLAWSFNIFKCGKYADIHGSPILGVPPLHCCLIAFSYAVYGSSLDSAQSVSIVFAALCSPLAFFMGRYLYNTLTGITAGILTATSFLLWVYSTRVLSETILTFFVNLFILFLYLTLKEGTKKYPLLLGLSLGLGYMAKELAGFLFPVLLLIIFEKRFAIRTRVRNFLLCVAAGAAVVAPWYIYLALTTQEGLSEIAGRPIAKGAAFTWGIRELEETVQIFTFGRTISIFILIFFYVGVAVAVHRYWRQRELSDKVLLLSIFTWVILLTFNIYLSTRERRLIPILIPLYVLSSRAFVTLYERVKKKEVSIEATKPIAFIFVVFLLSYWNARFIPEEWGGEFEFTSFHQENPLDYPLEVLFKDDCRRFSSQYDDAVVGGLLMNLFYFYTEGKYEACEIGMKKFSKMGSENVLYNYDGERGFSEGGLMKQICEKNVTVLVLYNHYKVEKRLSQNSSFNEK